MRLVYTKHSNDHTPGQEVKVGDRVRLRDGWATVEHFAKPHKPSSSGKVTVKYEEQKFEQEFYVSVIDAEWIEREDRA